MILIHIHKNYRSKKFGIIVNGKSSGTANISKNIDLLKKYLKQK